ncbi:unnamed protein product, partial [Vitis vinifera]|uniref:Vacuolar protein sorting-associated protein 25 n=1 Tax=Vitis vinifera TaxID=29760 RepID=E0CRT0_VITVI
MDAGSFYSPTFEPLLDISFSIMTPSYILFIYFILPSMISFLVGTCDSLRLEEEFSLFLNPVIERTLSHEAREAFLSALVLEGRAEWMDKGHKKCLILWHQIQDWADIILHFVRDYGSEDSVMTGNAVRN